MRLQRSVDAWAAAPPDQLRNVLRALARQPNTRVGIVSGRSRPVMDLWFGDIPGLTLGYVLHPQARRTLHPPVEQGK